MSSAVHNCKNCQHPLTLNHNYCPNCGGKIIKNRISVKAVLSEVVYNVFGWDNKYFFTIKEMILHPGVVLREYFDGTRKKYMNPITFLMIGASISLLLMTIFSESFRDLFMENSRQQTEFMGDTFGGIYKEEAYIKQQEEFAMNYFQYLLKYFNISIIVLMPLYSFIAFLVYRKPYNYGEHIVANCYIQGITFLTLSLCFISSIITGVFWPYSLNVLITILFYTYAYGKLYKLSIGQSILKIILFLLIIAALFIAIIAISAVVGVIMSKVFS